MSRPRETLGRRARVAGGILSSPQDAWMAVRMAGWRLVLPSLKRRVPLPRLVKLMAPRHPAASSRPEREARIAELARIVFRSQHRDRSGNCLERSLVLYRYLSAIGADPQLQVGLKRGDGMVKGHAWVTVHGETVEEPPDSVDGFAQVVSFQRGKSGLKG